MAICKLGYDFAMDMVLVGLTLPDPEHLSATCRAHTPSCRSTILHRYSLGIFHFLFSSAFNTVRLHLFCLLFEEKDRPFLVGMSTIGSHPIAFGDTGEVR
jgi:hypothetical protein